MSRELVQYAEVVTKYLQEKSSGFSNLACFFQSSNIPGCLKFFMSLFIDARFLFNTNQKLLKGSFCNVAMQQICSKSSASSERSPISKVKVALLLTLLPPLSFLQCFINSATTALQWLQSGGNKMNSWLVWILTRLNCRVTKICVRNDHQREALFCVMPRLMKLHPPGHLYDEVLISDPHWALILDLEASPSTRIQDPPICWSLT